MQRVFILTLLWALVGAGSVPTVRADQSDPRLDGLFDQLRSAPVATAARRIEARIWSIWSFTDDEAARAALTAGVVALRRGRLDDAEARFGAAIAAQPAFAEAWNKRATVRYLRGALGGSVADIQATLALEPRHFGALAGLGMIYDRLDRPEAARRSYRAALEIHPHLQRARERIGILDERLEGDRI
ncbi:MAG: tetratricopeptide repeat protein [Pseudomonadota bacterium]